MHRAKKGEPPSVDWARWVEESIRRLQEDRPIPYRPTPPTGTSEKPPFWTDITTVPESDPVEYQATITPGYLTYQNATATEAEKGIVGWISPKVDVDGSMVSLEAPSANDAPTVPPWSAPSVALPAPQSWVYLRVKTDADGAPKFEDDSVTIEAFDSEQTSIHHVRPSPSGGEEEGDYFFLILETEGNGATPEAPRVRRRITGNRSLPNQLVEIANIGGKREVYKGYLVGPDDKHEFRSIEQIEGAEEGQDSGLNAIPIIKPLDGGDSEADPPIPAEEEGETIKWRFISERATSPQVRVKASDGGGGVIVEGNGYENTYFDVFEGSISVVDGLVTNINGPASEGLTASFNWTFTPPGASDPEELRLSFSKGVLLSATRKPSGGVHEAVINGAAVTFSTYDTN